MPARLHLWQTGGGTLRKVNVMKGGEWVEFPLQVVEVKYEYRAAENHDRPRVWIEFETGGIAVHDYEDWVEPA